MFTWLFGSSDDEKLYKVEREVETQHVILGVYYQYGSNETFECGSIYRNDSSLSLAEDKFKLAHTIIPLHTVKKIDIERVEKEEVVEDIVCNLEDGDTVLGVVE